MGHWHLEETVWYKAVLDGEADLLESRAEHLADIYHSLGAASTSLLFAWVVYLAYLMAYRVYFYVSFPITSLPPISFSVTHRASSSMTAHHFWLCIGVSVGLFFLILHLLRSCRSTTKWNLIVLKRHFIVRYLDLISNKAVNSARREEKEAARSKKP